MKAAVQPGRSAMAKPGRVKDNLQLLTLALPGVLEVRLDQSSGDLAVRYDTGGTSRELIRERLNRLGSFFVQTSLEQLTS